MHSEAVNINIEEVIQTRPIQPETFTRKIMWTALSVAFLIFFVAWGDSPKHMWGVFLVNVSFWFGLSLGGVMLTVIFQIVRATWCAPIRRIAEANVAFLPYAYMAFLMTYFGKEELYPWARGPMPGREWWMQPDFVYARFAVLFGLLVILMTRYVNMSLRGDVGLVKERTAEKHHWLHWPYGFLTLNWRGSEIEIPALQNKMSWNAPLIVIAYAVVVSLFSFEMMMGMDTIWYSNMFGGFQFLGNIYMSWAMTIILAVYFAAKSPAYNRTLSKSQLWDLGKLTYGFCMLWGYTFFSQYLPQWYGNMPEETQWLILRTKEYPWKPVAWIVFAMCFIIPFILLLSEDLKKTPPALATVACIVLGGIWMERYVVIMPQLFPGSLPFGVIEVALFIGFFAAYFLSVTSFMSKYPYIPVSHPQSSGLIKW